MDWTSPRNSGSSMSPADTLVMPPHSYLTSRDSCASVYTSSVGSNNPARRHAFMNSGEAGLWSPVPLPLNSCLDIALRAIATVIRSPPQRDITIMRMGWRRSDLKIHFMIVTGRWGGYLFVTGQFSASSIASCFCFNTNGPRFMASTQLVSSPVAKETWPSITYFSYLAISFSHRKRAWGVMAIEKIVLWSGSHAVELRPDHRWLDRLGN